MDPMNNIDGKLCVMCCCSYICTPMRSSMAVYSHRRKEPATITAVGGFNTISA